MSASITGCSPLCALLLLCHLIACADEPPPNQIPVGAASRSVRPTVNGGLDYPSDLRFPRLSGTIQRFAD